MIQITMKFPIIFFYFLVYFLSSVISLIAKGTRNTLFCSYINSTIYTGSDWWMSSSTSKSRSLWFWLSSILKRMLSFSMCWNLKYTTEQKRMEANPSMFFHLFNMHRSKDFSLKSPYLFHVHFQSTCNKCSNPEPDFAGDMEFCRFMAWIVTLSRSKVAFVGLSQLFRRSLFSTTTKWLIITEKQNEIIHELLEFCLYCVSLSSMGKIFSELICYAFIVKIRVESC